MQSEMLSLKGNISNLVVSQWSLYPIIDSLILSPLKSYFTLLIILVISYLQASIQLSIEDVQSIINITSSEPEVKPLILRAYLAG